MDVQKEQDKHDLQTAPVSVRMMTPAQKRPTDEVVGVPERLVAMLANLGVRARVDEEHQDEHEVTSQAGRLREKDRQGRLLANLRLFDVEHVDICAVGRDLENVTTGGQPSAIFEKVQPDESRKGPTLAPCSFGQTKAAHVQ